MINKTLAACFARMQLIQQRLRERDLAPGTYDELSMGMSNDFELAIAYGATTVRVGEAIFGPRLSAAGVDHLRLCHPGDHPVATTLRRDPMRARLLVWPWLLVQDETTSKRSAYGRAGLRMSGKAALKLSGLAAWRIA